MDDSLARLLFIGIGFLAAGTYATLAVVAYRQRARHLALGWWTLYCVVAGVHVLSMAAGEFVHSATQAEATIRCALSLGALSMFFFFVFAIHVTELRKGRRIWLVLGSLWGALAIGLIWSGDLVVQGVTESEFARFSPVTGPLTPLYMNYVAFNWVFALVLFVRRFRRVRGRERTQTAYTLLACGFGLVGSAGFLMPSVTGSQSLLALAPAFLFPLFPLTITYAMIRLRLWDVRTIAHRTAVWVVLSALLLLPIYGLLWLVAHLAPAMSTIESAVGLVFLFLLAAVYMGMVKPRLDALFGRQAYDRRRVQDRHEREMVGIKTPAEVLDLMRETLAFTLQPTWIRLWTRRFESDWSESAWPEGEEVPEGWDLTQSEILGRILQENGAAVERGQLEKDQGIVDGQRVLLRWMMAWDAYAAFCLCGKDHALGVVFLGERKSLKPYSRGDLELLDSISASTHIGLTNAFLFDRVDAQRSDLEDLTVNLEKRVAQRTEEIDEANKQLRSVNERLRELDRVKSQFFANISHELRTPLSLILAPVDSMLDGSVGAFSSEQTKHLESMHRNGMQLFRLIEDLLDLCLLEDSRLRLNIEPVDLKVFLGALVDAVNPLAQRKSIALDLSVAGEVRLEADAEKLERILINLLGNAMRFTEENGRVSLVAGEEGEGVWIKVVDDGCGIAASDQPKIFERFSQGTQGGFRPQGGAGIGLALALELSKLHGGSLEVESEEGIGTTFLLRLPKSVDGLPPERIERRLSLREVAEERRLSGQGQADWNRSARCSRGFRLGEIERATEKGVVERLDGAGPKAARVLVVDDNKDLLQYLHSLLSERYEVWPVQDGAQALAMLRKEHHELVLADVMMPGMTGLELCHRIKSDPALLDVPVVLLTARSGQEHRIEGHGVGADQYLTKPFKPQELLAVVDRLLKGRSRVAESSAWRRSASLDSLLAGMAHELRNACHQAKSAQVAFQRIMEKGLADTASLREPASTSRLQSMAAIVERALERIERVVNSLQDYAGERMDAPWVSVSLKAMLEEEIPGLTLAESKSAKVELDLDAAAIVRGPAEALRQAVINLVENALHAVESGGRVQVKASVQAGEVFLVVEDDGCGIPPEQKEAIFDLFFTTRAPGQGTGMGLALAKKTIEEMGGSLSVESQVGEGSRFTAIFPKEMVAEQTEKGEMR